MTLLIKKAQKGNTEAFMELYQANKQRVWYLCKLLLCDIKAADNACIQIFKQSWDSVTDGAIQSETEFALAVEKKAV